MSNNASQDQNTQPVQPKHDPKNDESKREEPSSTEKDAKGQRSEQDDQRHQSNK